MVFKVWGTNSPPITESGCFHDLLVYIFIEDIEAENMLEACRKVRETRKDDYRYFRVTGGGPKQSLAVEFDSQPGFPESELADALGVAEESHE